MTTKIYYLMLAVFALALAGCKNDGPADIEYFPFQSEPNGKWGMMSPDGKVLIESEFKYAPTVATDGRFWAMNDKGYYELFTTDKTPKKIGEEYRYVSNFYNGRAIVTQRDHPASIIDRDGKLLVDLNKIEGKTPSYIFSMSEGIAVYMTDTVCGAINYDGEVVIKPKYAYISMASDGKIIARDRGFTLFDMEDLPDSVPEAFSTVYNYKGEELLKISNRKYCEIGSRFYGDYLAVSKKIDGENVWGIINVKGETVVPVSKKYKSITQINENGFIYYDESSKYGMCAFDGSTLVRAKYDYLSFVDKEILAGTIFPENDAENLESRCELVGINGTVISKRKYMSIEDYIPTGYKSAIVCIAENHYSLIDRKGERVSDVPDIAYASAYVNSYSVLSDYVDVPALLDNIGFSDDGLDSLTFNSSVRSVLDRQARYFSYTNKPKAEDYASVRTVNIYRTLDGLAFTENINFPNTLAMQTYRQEKVIDYVDYYWNMYWYHMRNVPTGHQFRSINPSSFELNFDNYGALRGKLRPFYTHLASRFKKMGTVEDENDAAILVRLNNGKKAAVWLDEHEVKAVWGNLNSEQMNIGIHAGNKEKLSVEDVLEEGDI